MSAWQSEEQRCAVVLHEVFGWLGARELARAGSACWAWRCAAAEPALWRRLLYAGHNSHFNLAGARVSWRQEYVLSRAGWRLAASHRAPDTLLHAALAPGAPLLALAGADASVGVWRRDDAWREVGRASMRERGWSAVARAHWAGRERLLLAGPLALVADWELVVLRVEEDGRCGSVASRVRCSAGAAGCWADAAGDAFFSFELHRLGASLYCTTVWLNAATQETDSEYAGVTSPLLRIYNEDGAHLTHALVAEVPRSPPDDYLRAMEPVRSPAGGRMLVTAAGCALSAWRVWAPRPPALHARSGGGLAERVRRLRERRAAPEPDVPEPDEAAVRAACTAPDHNVRLAAPLVGLVVHERCWRACGPRAGRRAPACTTCSPPPPARSWHGRRAGTRLSCGGWRRHRARAGRRRWRTPPPQCAACCRAPTPPSCWCWPATSCTCGAVARRRSGSCAMRTTSCLRTARRGRLAACGPRDEDD